MTGRSHKLITISLSRAELARLSALAAANERDPYQQARWILLRELRETEPQLSGLDEEPERVAV